MNIKTLALLLSLAKAHEDEFDYDQLGADWPTLPKEEVFPNASEEQLKDLVNECSGKN